MAAAQQGNRKLDLLLMSALIGLRSAEGALSAHAPRTTPLAPLYSALGGSEARHFGLYIGFARTSAPAAWRARLATLAAYEAELTTAPDRSLRFHSGPLG